MSGWFIACPVGRSMKLLRQRGQEVRFRVYLLSDVLFKVVI